MTAQAGVPLVMGRCMLLQNESAAHEIFSSKTVSLLKRHFTVFFVSLRTLSQEEVVRL